MTDTEALSVTDAIARVEAVLTSLRSVSITPATVNPDGTPGNVAPGELIESAWGNAVANTIADQQDSLAILDQVSDIETDDPPGPWTGATLYTRRGNFAWVEINVSRTTGPLVTFDFTVATLPTWARPYPSSVYGVVQVASPPLEDDSSNEYSRTVLIDASDGTVKVVRCDMPETTGGSIRGSFVFPVNPAIEVP